MSRRVALVILCEDGQHEAFVRRLAERLLGKGVRKPFRVLKCPPSEESAEAWVRKRLPAELGAHRSAHAARALVVITDDDGRGRENDLRRACQDDGVPWPTPGDGVLVLVPGRNIETWLAYLDGTEVDEVSPYKRLPRPSDCAPHVAALAEMCDKREVRAPAPPSLRRACDDYEPFRKAVTA